MKFNKLTAAVLAGLLSLGAVMPAQAVNVNPDGLGQVLLYPYYTTNADNATLLSVVNTTGNAKAVKVRFLEGQNSREVLDFNLYLSAFDVWAAGIVDIDGTPTLVVNDSTCTVPYIYADKGFQEFLPWAMDDKNPEEFDNISRASEGHFEMIEMGTIAPGSATETSVTHVDGLPADCINLVDAWTQGIKDNYWVQDSFKDMLPPSGGLFGGAAIINVKDGAMFSYDATAINGFASKLDAADDMHQEPGTILPSLDSGDIKTGSIFLANGSSYTSGEFARGVDALSFVLMHDSVMNSYSVEDSVAAETEWVVTFPTKQFYVHQGFLNEYAAFRNTSAPTAPIAPFTSTWTWSEGEGTNFACEEAKLEIWDREEGTPIAPPDAPRPPLVSPRPPGVTPEEPEVFELCYETQVVKFSNGDILGSGNVYTIETPYQAGWARIDLTRDSGLGGLAGLPVTGFAVQKFVNGTLKTPKGDNVLANYGGIFNHVTSRKLSSF